MLTIKINNPPNSDRWENAGRNERIEYFKILGAWAAKFLKERFKEGLDQFGQPLLPVLDPSRRPGNGPPLIPRTSGSRSITELRFKADEDAATLYWTEDWGRILEYHQQGIPSRVGLRIRDVGGFTPGELNQIFAKAKNEWESTTSAPRPARVINQPRRTAQTFGSFFNPPR